MEDKGVSCEGGLKREREDESAKEDEKKGMRKVSYWFTNQSIPSSQSIVFNLFPKLFLFFEII